MAQLPDGWIFIPKMKNLVTIELEQRELVMCRNCRHGDCFDKFVICRKTERIQVPPDFYCADGKRKEGR